jgi:CheY-like chemotaxis protein
MVTSEEFERELQEALGHLYDPGYRPSNSLCAVAGCDPSEETLGVQSVILRGIQDLEPSPDTPPGARTRTVYDLLHYRFVLKLPQEETAKRLHMSLASAWRAQREAVHVLARLLWERSQVRQRPAEDRAQVGEDRPLGEEALHTQALDWRSQMQRELESLQASAPDALADVGETINGVLELESAWVSRHDAHVEVGSVQPDLVTAIHPSVLRQILISAVRRLATHTSGGPITIFARLEDGNVKIALTGAITSDERPTESALVRDIVAPEGVSVRAHLEGDHAFLWVELPSVGKITVLVVDDNADMARFYRRATQGTSYHIVHTAEGQGLFEVIKAVAPDVIVLDIMLSDVDGWELLIRLHKNRATRSIPIIVCSVVREEELALSLGAARYLSKPVRPREFIQALDRVLPRAPAGVLRSPSSNATAC